MQVSDNSTPSPELAPREAAPAGRFWSFSLRLYALDGAAPACLELQDRHGCDVNMGLFCLWLASEGRDPSSAPELVPNATALSADWARRAVRPLRAVRRDLKAGVDGVEWAPVREAIKAVELKAEQAQQMALERLAPSASPARGGDPAHDRDALAVAFFDAYAAAAGLAVRADSSAFMTLRRLAQAVPNALPNAPPETLADALPAEPAADGPATEAEKRAGASDAS